MFLHIQILGLKLLAEVGIESKDVGFTMMSSEL